jgi:hypothetical protein
MAVSILQFIGNGALVTLKNKNTIFNQGIYLCSQFTEAVNLTLCKYSSNFSPNTGFVFLLLSKNDFNNFVDDISERNQATNYLMKISI